jgi:hypothetical protein
MARLADEIWELPWAPPQVLCYKPGLRTEGEGGFSIAQMKSLMEEQRRLVAAAPVYAADDIAEYFWYTASRDRDLTVGDFPAVAIPGESAFIEFRKPGLQNMVGAARLVRESPALWGWHVTRHEPVDFCKLFRLPAAQPGCAAGLVCTLWLSPDGKSLLAPLAAVGLQVSGDAELLGGPIESLAFVNDPERVHDPRRLFAYFRTLFLPAVMAMAFLACKSTTIGTRVAEAKLNRARVKRKRRPLVAYHTIECSTIKDILRHDGLAGVQGLAAALRKCRHHFVQDMRGRSSLIILPGTQ